MLRRLAFWLLIGALLAALSGIAWHLSRPEPIAVAVAQVAFGRVEETVANTRAGTVKACRRAWLAPATGGQIALLAVREGDRVQAGQILLEIWNEDLKSGLTLALRESDAAGARVEEACLASEAAEREARRQTRLHRQNLVSDELLDRAITDAKVKQAGCRAARAAAQVGVARAEVAAAQLERTLLKAPFDGVVAEVNGELGEFITPSPPGIPTLPAVDLIDDTCMYVSAPMDEVDAPRLRAGMSVCVSLDAFSDRICQGRLRRIAPYVLDREKQARTVEVEVEFSRPEDVENLLVGYSADVEVTLDTREKVLRIPTEAVMEGHRVLVLPGDGGPLAERAFKAGLSNWRHTEVVSGLHEGERVVTSIDREGVAAGALAIQDTSEPADGEP